MRWSLALVLGLVGCGGNEFNATYENTVVFTNDCGTMPETHVSTKLVLTLTQNGSTVTIDGLSCPLTGTASGTQVTIPPTACPTDDANGNALGYSASNMQYNAPALVIEINTADTLADGTSCTGTISAPMAASNASPVAWVQEP